MKLGELAARLGCKLEGDEDVEIHGVAGIEDAQAGEVTFLSNPRYARELGHDAGLGRFRRRQSRHRTRAWPAAARRAPIRTIPYLDFARAIESVFRTRTYPPGIHPTAVVAKSAKIGEGSAHRSALLCRRRSGNRPQRRAA